MGQCSIKAILFDFGGVIADEGFKNGLYRIARANGLDEEEFAEKTRQIIHGTGYLTGKGSEESFWQALRSETGIKGSDLQLRGIILEGFVLRAWMIQVIQWLERKGISLAILSDQTNWLDEIESRTPFFHLFGAVFNSYYIGKSKLDKSIFSDVLKTMNLKPQEALFVDDTEGHVDRAREVGLNAIHFVGKDDFLKRLSTFCHDLPRDF